MVEWLIGYLPLDFINIYTVLPIRFDFVTQYGFALILYFIWRFNLEARTCSKVFNINNIHARISNNPS